MPDPCVVVSFDDWEADDSDDLLDCPCIDMSPEERAGLITDPAVEDRLDDDEGDDETTKGFAPASQYDAEVSLARGF